VKINGSSVARFTRSHERAVIKQHYIDPKKIKIQSGQRWTLMEMLLKFSTSSIVLAGLLSLLTACSTTVAPTKYKKKDFQAAWCEEIGGEAEVVFKDGTRIACLTDEYAVEVDYSEKWAESIGQSLYNATITNKKPGVLLITRGDEDQRYLTRLKTVAIKTNVTIWTTPLMPSLAHFD
jgi:hypothetical protein